MNVDIRPETASDFHSIREVADLAFDQPNEGLLVVKLRMNPLFSPKLSLVAHVEDKIVGHILLFPITIVDRKHNHSSLALAPVAVIPEMQNCGIGSTLIRAGLKAATEEGYSSVIVLGHSDFYARFGFKPASHWNIHPSFVVSDEVYMAMELVNGGLSGVSGKVKYPSEFDDVE
jgi:Predicted acetyltransferase